MAPTDGFASINGVRDRFQRSRFLGGTALAVLGGVDLSLPGAPRWPVDVVFLIAAAIWLSPSMILTPYTPVRPEFGDLPGVRLRARGLVFVLMGVLIGAFSSLLLWNSSTANWSQALPLWLLGLIFLLVAGWIALPGDPQSQPSKKRRLPAFEVVMFSLVILVATAARTVQLDQVPPGVFIDETNGALDGLAILAGKPVSPFGTGWYQIPSGYMYLFAAYLAALGPTIIGLRLNGIVNGVLAVAGLYALARHLFGVKVAFASALLLAFASWAITTNRWGWVESAPPAVHLWSMYFLVKGMRNGRPFHFALSGALLGLGMYSYPSIRLVIVAVVVFLVYWAILDRRLVRSRLQHLALFAMTLVIVFSPLAVTYIQQPFLFLNRTSEVTIMRDVERAGSLAPIAENARRHLLMFNVMGDPNARHGVPGRPMLDPVTGALFIMGLVRSCLHLKDFRFGLVLIWIPIILLGGVLSALAEGPQGFRTVGVVPAVALIAGEFLVAWIASAKRGVETNGKGSMRIAALVTAGAAAIAAAVALNLHTVFGEFATDPRVKNSFTPTETEVARELLAASDLGSYHLAPRLYHFSPGRYFTMPWPIPRTGTLPPPAFHRFTGMEDLPITDAGQKNVVVLWGPEWAGFSEVLLSHYPSARIDQVSKHGSLLYERAYLGAEETSRDKGLTAEYLTSTGTSRTSRIPSPPVGVTDATGEIKWSGAIFLPRHARWAIQSIDGAVAKLDGVPADGSRVMSKGTHEVQLVQSPDNSRKGLQLVRRDPDSRSAELVRDNELSPLVAGTNHGLLGSYYAGAGWQGSPIFTRVDPTPLFDWADKEPLDGAFSVRWEGEIHAQAAGKYTFLGDADDGVRLILDGAVAAEAVKADSNNAFEVKTDLSAGWHTIRIEYFQSGGAKAVSLRWAPPGRPATIIPPSELRPQAP